MRPDEMMAWCAASGINFIVLAQRSMPDDQARKLASYDGATPKQSRSLREREWSAEDVAHACAGMDKDTHRYLEERYYAAFVFRYAGAVSVRPKLRLELLLEISRLANNESWKLVRTCANCDGSGKMKIFVRDPKTGKAIMEEGGWKTTDEPCQVCVTGLSKDPKPTRGTGTVQVVRQLVDLAIFEEWLEVHYVTGLLQFRQLELWPGLIGIEKQIWQRVIYHQYRTVQATIDRWCGIAYSHAAKRLGDEENVDVA